MWRSGTFFLYTMDTGRLSEPKKMLQRLPDINHSVVLWSVGAIGSVLASCLQFFWECATHPNIHLTSRYVTAHEIFSSTAVE